MLTLTENASAAVRTLTEQAGLPQDTGGVRIAEREAGGFDLALVAAPAPEDELVTDGTARVYVEQRTAQILADQRLDAEPAPTGGSAFTLSPQ